MHFQLRMPLRLGLANGDATYRFTTIEHPISRMNEAGLLARDGAKPATLRALLSGQVRRAA